MCTLRAIVLLPVWVASIFSTAKSFVANPVLGSYHLNRAGVHVARITLAYGLTRIRHALLAGLASPPDRRAFQRDGYLAKENFLPLDLFTAVEREARGYRGKARSCYQGDTVTRRVLLDHETLARLPACASLVRNRRFRRLIKYCAARNHAPLIYIQRIENHAIDGGDDPQRILHSDTFHPTVKAWLFLDDVDEGNGPFTYVPGSHRLSWRRLGWEYRKSISWRELQDPYSKKGSLRLTDSERRDLGLGEPVRHRVRRNTLIIANTHGFHCRGHAAQAMPRLEIWVYSRTNPFNPFPGLDSRLLERVQHWFFKAYLRRLDRRAERAGGRPSWRLTDWHED